MNLPESGLCRRYVVIVLSCCFAPAVFSAEPQLLAAQNARTGWEQLDLSKTTIAGTKVYYEKCLEPNLPVFEKKFQEFLAAKDRLATVLTKREEIIADISRILGATDPNNTSRQREVFARIATPLFSNLKPAFYLVRTATIKDFLRAGGQLPDFSYDRQEDNILYSPRIRMVEGTGLPEDFDVCVPIGADREFGRYVSAMLNIFQKFLGSGMVDAAIHEITEMTLVERVRPGDPYWRWFSDGFSNAITYALIEKYMGREAADEFAARNGVGKYGYLEKEVNLRYWMMANFFVDVTPMPVQAAADLEYARYALAMAEAQAIVDRHGIDCVRRIVDAVSRSDSRRGSDVLEVIKDVTGEDMEERLGHYQTFKTAAEGVAKYEQAYEAARQESNYEQMFVNVLRLMELRGDVFSHDYLLSFKEAAWILYKLGREDAGDEVMRNAIELYSTGSIAQVREAALESFVLYALDCNNPRKADSAADELLGLDPEHVPSLVVKMLVNVEDDELARAKAIAEQVCCLAKEGSQARALASKILTMDPNRPDTHKEARGTHDPVEGSK